MEADGAVIIQGNTDVAVADFDYAAAFPWYAEGVPDPLRYAAEWAHDALGDERLDWLRRLLAERRLRPGPRCQRHPGAPLADRRPDHLLRPHPPAGGPRLRLEAGRQRRQ